ncbi:MAG: cation diffusion facilitator family transporter [Bdellovibrionota bacterium]|nr:MAG: cation diffusion facilitator family transporter [Bdellovibrionota bacterium]
MTPHPHTSQNREQALRLSVLATLFGLLPTTYAVVISNSVVLISDLLRCVVEFGAIFLSWLIIRRVERGDSTFYDYGFGKLEQAASLLVATALILSFVVTATLAVHRLMHPEQLEQGGFGLVLAVLSIGANGGLWLHNARLASQHASPILDSQWRLFRAKTFAALVVALSLLIGMTSTSEALAMYADPAGSALMAAFFLVSAIRLIFSSMEELLDRSIGEGMRLLILRTLVNHEGSYEGVESIRTRRSGGKIFIDLRLGFSARSDFGAVAQSIEKIRQELQSQIPGSEIQILPYCTAEQES